MKQPRLTKSRFARLSPADQTAVYFRHPDNMKYFHDRPDGPSQVAQGEWVSDWRMALAKFASKLPHR
jgi:hypothetical protein